MVDEVDNFFFDVVFREVEEEVGLFVIYVDVVGMLFRYWIISGYEIVLVVGFVNFDFILIIDKNEVESVFEVFFVYVLDRRNYLVYMMYCDKKVFLIYFILWKNCMIWGVMVVMLCNLFYYIYF